MRIECPECGTKLEVAPNHPTRPFCSPRCKLLDLGRWFGEEVRIAGQPKPEGFEDNLELDLTSDLAQDPGLYPIHET